MVFARCGSATRWLLFCFTPVLLLGLLLALLAAPALAATLEVCPAGGEYTTIQAAVNAAQAGDVIRICADVYAENVDLAAMGSGGGSMGDITVQGAGAVTITPATGNAIYLGGDFSGDITLDNLGVTSPDDNAVFLGRTIFGALTISGVHAVGAGSGGVLAFDVTEGAAVRGATFMNNGGAGLLLATTLEDSGCGGPGPFGQAGGAQAGGASTGAQTAGAGVDAIVLTGTTASGNGGGGFVLDATYGDIRIGGSEAEGNGGDGFNVASSDPCGGSTVLVEGSRAQNNGGAPGATSGSGLAFIAPRVQVANVLAAGNLFDGIEQRLGEPVQVADTWSLQVVSSTARANGRHGVSAASVDFVTITNVSAISNAFAGILIPFTPLIGPFTSGAGAQAAPADQGARIAHSLVMSNGVGIELFYEEVAGAARPAAGAIAAITTASGGNIVCANTAAGVFAWGAADPTYSAAPNYWGSFSGPFHAVKNPAGTGDAVVDATSGSGGAGDVLFAPWVDAGVAGITPTTGFVGAAQALTASFLAGGGPGLVDSPGNPNDGPLFVARTDNGVLTSAYGRGPAVPVAPATGTGLVTATLTPAAAGAANVTISGPCGLVAAQNVRVASPSVAIAKNPLRQTVTSGGAANFQIAITNTGDITLTQVAVSDAAAPACGRDLADLAPGASVGFTCQQPGVVISHTNQITVTASPLIEPAALPAVVVSATAVADVVVAAPTGLTPAPEPGDVINRLYLPALGR